MKRKDGMPKASRGSTQAKAVGGSTIAKISAEFGVTKQALRFYEERGLLVPIRRRSVRIYSKHDRARVAYIVQAKRIGLTITQISQAFAAP